MVASQHAATAKPIINNSTLHRGGIGVGKLISSHGSADHLGDQISYNLTVGTQSMGGASSKLDYSISQFSSDPN